MRSGIGRLLLLCCLSCASGHYEQIGSTGITPFRLERYDVYLANGLRVILEPDHRSPMVALTTMVRAGAAQDPSGRSGLAYLTARLTLRTPDASASTRREAYVVTAAAEASAVADVDQTTLEATGPSAMVGLLLRLQAAQLYHPLDGLTAEALSAERAQIDRERQLRVEAVDSHEITAHLRRILFRSDQSYARSPEGDPAGLAAVSRSDVEAFARRYYTPAQATLVVVGNVEPSRMQAMVSAIYGSPVSRAAGYDDWTFHPQPVAAAAPLRELETVEGDVGSPELLMGWLLPGRYDTSAPPGELLASVAQHLLIEASWPPARELGLMQPVTALHHAQIAPPPFVPERATPLASSWLSPRQDGAPDSPNTWRSPFALDRMSVLSGLPGRSLDTDIASIEVFAVPGVYASMLVCRVKLREGSHPKATVENVLEHLRPLWEDKRHREVFLTRAELSVQVVLESESLAGRSRLIASLASFVGGSHAISKTLDRLNTPVVRVSEFAWDYLRRDRMRALLLVPRPRDSSIVLLPARSPSPAAALAPPPSTRETSEHLTLGLPHDVRTIDPETINSVTLKNGIEVITVTRRVIPVVTVGAMLRVGLGSGRPLGVVDAALRVTRPGRRFGLPSDFGVIELEDARPDTITFEQHGGVEHLGKMLAILSDRLKHQYVDPVDYENFRRYTLPAWRREESRPLARADREFWKALFGEHAFGFRAVAADLAKVTVDDVRRWLALTYRPENLVVVIAGDVHPHDSVELARTWLEDWQNDTTLPRGEVHMMIPELEAPDEADTVIVTRRPGSPMADIRLGCLLPDSVGERDVVAYDLASELLARRLERSLQPAVGGAGVANDSGRLLGGTTVLVVSTTVNAPAAAAVVRGLRAHLDQLASGPATAAELDEARWSVMRRHLQSLLSASETVQAILEVRKRGLSVGWFQRLAPRLGQTSAAQVQGAFAACAQRTVLSLVAEEPHASTAAAEWKRAEAR